MFIPLDRYASIRELNIDAHKTQCMYEHWEESFIENPTLLSSIGRIKADLGGDFTRTDIVKFYRTNVPPKTKFIAAMVWGNEAPAESKRDPRGPWRVATMFSDIGAAESILAAVSVRSPAEILKSYKLINGKGGLKGCGPNFFTKHFYFLGKSMNLNPYPLIFDDRVANGLLKLSLSDAECLQMLKPSTITKPDAYMKYLNFVYAQAKRIECEAEQIEYYLFNL